MFVFAPQPYSLPTPDFFTPSPIPHPPPCHPRVTVSWYDGPGVAGSTGKALINNLDLLVVGPNKSPMYVCRRCTRPSYI